MDGVVLSGRAVADEAMLTGEAALVPKQTGDRVSGYSHTNTAHVGIAVQEAYWLISTTKCQPP